MLSPAFLVLKIPNWQFLMEIQVNGVWQGKLKVFLAPARSHLLYNYLLCNLYLSSWLYQIDKKMGKEIFHFIVLSLWDCVYSHINMFPKAAAKWCSSVILLPLQFSSGQNVIYFSVSTGPRLCWIWMASCHQPFHAFPNGSVGRVKTSAECKLWSVEEKCCLSTLENLEELCISSFFRKTYWIFLQAEL